MKLKLLVLCLVGIGFAENTIAKDLFKIKDIRVEGLKVIDSTTVFGYMPIKIGDNFTDTKGEQIIKKLYSTGYFDDIHVEILGQNVLVTVQERPIIGNLEIKGSKSFSNNQLKENFHRLGIAPAKIYNPAVLHQLIYALKQDYMGKGKNNPAIEYKIIPLERNRINIEINITEGETTRIKSINFNGNAVFSSRKLKNLLSLTTPGLLTWLTKSDLFSPDKFYVDQKKITDYYMNKGYFDFKITGLDVKPIDKDEYGLEIDFDIFEGPRYKFGDISLVGDTKEVPLPELENIFKRRKKTLFTSKWFNNSDLSKIVSGIKNKMGEYGYAKAEVDVESSKDETNNTNPAINFILKIIPNNKIYVNQIDIVGNNKTRDEVVRREFRQLENSVYNLKKINRSEERINNLGFFENVDIKEIPVKDIPYAVNLEATVKELHTGSFQLSVTSGESEKVAFIGGFSHDNLFGTGKSVNAMVNIGTISKDVSFKFTDPYFTKDNISLGYNLFWTEYDPNKIETSAYKHNKTGGDLRLGVPISDIDKINFGIGVHKTNLGLYDRSPLFYRNYVAEHGRKFLSYIGNIGFSRDTTDSYIWPTVGYIINSSLDFNLPGSKFLYYGISYSQTLFFPITNIFTLMIDGNLGLLYKYGKSKTIPFFKNYYLGGTGSVRGYEANSLGPKINDWYGSVDFLGGTKTSRLSTQLLFPFPGLQDDKKVRLGLFADIGSVWDGKTYKFDDFNEYEGIHKSTFRSELRYSVGISAVWLSPLGPLQFSYGIPLKKRKGDRLRRFQFQMGTTF